MKILTSKNQEILVDKEDYDFCNKFKWYISKTGYATNDSLPRKLMHRLIMGFPEQYVDHINGNKLDNRRCNLRLCNQSQNSSNTKIRSTNKSGYKGVSWNKKYEKWECYLTFNYKHVFGGYFDSKVEAALAYNNKATELWGEFAKLNVIEKFDTE